MWAKLLALAALLPLVAAGCELELQISTPDTVLDVSGTLGALIDIELVSMPPTASGARAARRRAPAIPPRAPRVPARP
jgi:hypothetical protein